MEKLKVILHVGDTAVVKLWRFDPSKIVEYSRNEVEAMLIDLSILMFRRKDCVLSSLAGQTLTHERVGSGPRDYVLRCIHYEDELVGKVTIESDGGMIQALKSFTDHEVHLS